MNERIEKVLAFLEDNGIEYKNHTHPPLPTIELALEYWKEIDSTHCKNLFFRNRKEIQSREEARGIFPFFPVRRRRAYLV